MKAGLRAAYLDAHPELAPAQVAGPLPGRTFYGSSGAEWAVTTFSVAGKVSMPVVFVGAMGSEWTLSRQTHGAICAPAVPRNLIVQVWKLRHLRGSCYTVS